MLNKISLILVFASIQISLLAQNTSNVSPYSRYYIGENYDNVSSPLAASGGVFTTNAEYSLLNMGNPASYAFLKKYRPIFSVDFQQKLATLESNGVSQKTNVFNFSKFGMGLPVSEKVGLSFGLVPFSTVGYDIKQTQTTSDAGDVTYMYQGDGGVNRLYFGGAYKVLSNDTNTISIGLNLSYGFGGFSNMRKVEYSNSAYYNSIVERQVNVNGLVFDFGAIYKTRFGKNNSFTAGATIRPSFKFNAKETYLAGNYYLNTGGAVIVNDTTKSFTDQKGTITMPGFMAFGMSAQFNNKWEVAAQLMAKNNAYYRESLSSSEYSDSLINTVALGATVIHTPADKYNRNNSIFNRATYRFGVRYEDNAIQVNQYYASNFGMSFGVDIPVSVSSSSKDNYHSMSQIHLGIDYGSKGTTDNGLVRENSWTFLFGLSLIPGTRDRWFMKRKIN